MHASDYGRALWTDYNAFVDGLPSDDVTMVWNTWEDGGAYHCEMPGVSNPQAIMLDWIEDRLDPVGPLPVGAGDELGA
jgi:hypothetical protein